MERKCNKFVEAKLNHARSFDYCEIFNYVIISRKVYFSNSIAFFRASSRAGVDKFNVRADAWKSPRSESRNSKRNKFAVTASARALIRDRSSTNFAALFANALAWPAIRIRVHSSFTHATSPRTFTSNLVHIFARRGFCNAFSRFFSFFFLFPPENLQGKYNSSRCSVHIFSCANLENYEGALTHDLVNIEVLFGCDHCAVKRYF